MRIYLTLSASKTILPFNYQHLLTSAIHKWIGPNNDEHGNLSLYSFSWLKNVKVTSDKQGLLILPSTQFFISAYEDKLITQIVNGIFSDRKFYEDIIISNVDLKADPVHDNEYKFMPASPVLIKVKDNNKGKHLTFDDPSASEHLTASLKNKFDFAGLDSTAVNVRFDLSYEKAKTKLVYYKGIANKSNLCPVIISGNSAQIAFAWNVGVGNSTGIGFGALE